MREKGKMRKEKKILIRVNKDEKALAETLSRAEGKNTSEFFRTLLAEREHMNGLNPIKTGLDNLLWKITQAENRLTVILKKLEAKAQ